MFVNALHDDIRNNIYNHDSTGIALHQPNLLESFAIRTIWLTWYLWTANASYSQANSSSWITYYKIVLSNTISAWSLLLRALEMNSRRQTF